MLLKKITINDFGIYRGCNEFKVSATVQKPIVLCGGINGAGKTTLFESIPLCLYGQNSYDKKITLKQYHKIITKSFHRYAKEKRSSDEASISVEFQYAYRGKIDEYRIVRMWQNNDGQIEEMLVVEKKNNDNFETLDVKSGFQLFIDQLLPKGITNLFFFDGEKIQKIADSGGENEHIRESFESLLGLDLARQLSEDIGVYLLRNSGSQAKKTLEELEQNTKEKQERTEKLDSMKEKQVFTQTEINSLQKNLAIHEEKFSKIGGQFAKRRETFVADKTRLESKLYGIEEQMRTLCSDLLPFAILPKQLREIKVEIKDDMQKIQNRFEQDILKRHFDDILKQIHSQGYLQEIKKIFDERLDLLPESSRTMFNFSISDMNDFIKMIDAVTSLSAKDIGALARSRDIIAGQLEKINASLSIAPKQDEVGPIFSDITRINREIGELEGELNVLRDLEAQEKSLIVMLNSKIRKNLSAKRTENRELSGMELGPKIQDVLEDYARMLRQEKISLLERYILDGIKTMFHKKDLIIRVSVDPDTFQVRLYKENDDEITREMLSKGELQIYATAIVWGLAKTSGRPLPFIIDTPLARLDMKHRQNLVDRFYPYASHQIIILSTDSEITDDYYNMLYDKISRSMVIQYNSKEGKTMVRDGYLFDDIKEKEIAVRKN